MYVNLRKLEEKDAPFMLEWMKDSTIACFFRFKADAMTIEDCKKYIQNSVQDDTNKHYAIVDANDEYLGTISLKDINYIKKSAEYAISTRKKVHGTGAAMAASKEIFQIGFEELGLECIYLNVLVENERANAFYKKIGFSYDYTEADAVEIRGAKKALNWYTITKQKYMEMKKCHNNKMLP